MILAFRLNLTATYLKSENKAKQFVFHLDNFHIAHQLIVKNQKQNFTA
jgi:hypothetical protein